MKITMIYNTVYAFATQRNATQRNAYHNYILNNNFKFYIFQFFRAFSFLSVFIRFAKIISLIKNSFGKNSLSLRGDSRSNPNFIKFSFYNLISLINKFYTKWIASLIPFVRNDNFNYAFSCALKNKFEIISQLNYGFCYKNYFFNLNQVFRNSYDFGERFGRNLNYGFGKDCNCNFKKNCDYDFEKNCNGGFGENYFGNCNFGFDFGNEICSIGNSLAGFLFNRKIKKINLCQRYSVGEGEQR